MPTPASCDAFLPSGRACMMTVVLRTVAFLAADGAGVPVMAKGQVKSNKEVRKPKAEKPKPSVSVGSSSPFTTPPGKK